jgi:large subunit ribosomal protein L4
VVIDQWTFEVPRTKDAVAALSALGLKGKILVVLGVEDGYADRSFGNLTDIQTIMASELNAYDILCNDWIVFTDATLPGDASDGPPATEAKAPAKDPAPAKAETAAADTAEAEAKTTTAAADEASAETEADTEAETTEGSDS